MESGVLEEFLYLDRSALLLDSSLVKRVQKAHAGIAEWLIHWPNAHPFWEDYMLGCVHLREEPELPRPVKHFKQATHEIHLLALNPAFAPWSFQKFCDVVAIPAAPWLEPPNVIVQIEATDEQAKKLIQLCAQACVNGYLAPEDMRSRWESSIKSTMEHIRFGGHPSDN